MGQGMHLAPEVYVILTLVCICSGFIDAVAGGGGLLTVPALLFAGIPPLNVLATNKLQSVMGTSMACYNFGRKGLIDWRRNRLSILLTFIGAGLGCIVVQLLDTHMLTLIVPILLVMVAGYVLLSPRMSDEDAHHRVGSNGYAPIASMIGFYDGFFGPGTGSFFTTTLVALRGYGLTKATALTKLLNLTSNLGGVILFAAGGHVFWLLGFCMAAGSMIGAWIGSHTAMRFGARVIRPLLVTISLALTARLLWSYVALLR
jgi:uncharacterized membrane protein YfcA